MHTLLISQHPPVRSESYEAIVLATALAHGAGLEYPTPQLVRWMEPFVGTYNNDPMYWQPYEELPTGNWALKVWARGGYGYLASTLPRHMTVPAPEHVDPASWFARMASMNSHLMSPELNAAFAICAEQTNPIDPVWGSQLGEFHDAIRRAAETGRLLTDSAAIRRANRRGKRSEYARPAH